MNKKQELKCLFGFHKYTIQSNMLPNMMICCLCHQYSHLKFSNGYEEWHEYNGTNWLRYQYRLPNFGVVMRLDHKRGWYRVGTFHE